MRFSESPAQIIDNTFVFIEYVQWKYIFSNNTMVHCPLSKTSTRFDYSNSCGAWKRQVTIEQTRLANLNYGIIIYSGVNFCGKNVCNIFWQDLFDDRWKNCQNHRTHKILYHSSVKPIPHMINEMAREQWWKSRNLNDCSDGDIYMEIMILRIELKSLLSEFNVLCSCRWGNLS